MKPISELLNKIMQNLNQSKDQRQSTVSNQVTLRCPYCGKERTVTTDKYPPGSYAGECSDCERVRREKHFLSLCPKLYQESAPDRLPASQLKEAMEWQYGPRGLILSGETGVGKSRIAWLLLRRILVSDKRNPSFAWFDAVGFGHAIGKHYRDEDAEEWLEDTAKTELLFFDDLGKLKLTERAETELFGLIERRCGAELPIIATTNDTGDSLASRMTDNRGPALIRRLRQFCQIIQFGQ